MKGFFEFITLFGVGRLFTLARNILKDYLITFYIDVVDGLRGVYFLLALTIAAIVLFFGGFFLLHVAMFVYLPWSDTAKMVLMLVLGSVYMLGSVTFLVCLQSRKRWIERSGAEKLLDDALDK